MVYVQILYKTEFFSGFLFATAKVANITAMIFPHIINFLALVIFVFLMFLGMLMKLNQRKNKNYLR